MLFLVVGVLSTVNSTIASCFSLKFVNCNRLGYLFIFIFFMLKGQSSIRELLSYYEMCWHRQGKHEMGYARLLLLLFSSFLSLYVPHQLISPLNKRVFLYWGYITPDNKHQNSIQTNKLKFGERD